MTTQAYRFVCYRWLLTPFKNNGHLTAVQIRYNEKHSGTRQVIERVLGLLKGRWRCLKCLEMEAVEEMPSVVSAGCVLHNFCLLADEGHWTVFWWWQRWWWFGQWWLTWPAFAPGCCKKKYDGPPLSSI